MVKKAGNVVLSLFLVLGFGLSAFSQKISGEKTSVVYRTAGQIKLKETPPTKGLVFISGPGKEIHTLDKDAEVVLLDKTVISTVFEDTIWVKVRELGSQKEGWTYWGTKEDSSANFKQK